jgi:hypothetical protein
MRILRFNVTGEPHSIARLGLMVGERTIAHLRACYARFLSETRDDPQAREIAALRFPPHVVPFLQTGGAGWGALETVHPWIEALFRKDKTALGMDNEQLFVDFQDCYVHIASRPASKLICIRFGPAAVDDTVPPLMVKSNGSVMGPQRKVAMPRGVTELAGHAALGVVIGRKCKDVAEADVSSVIAGYTVVGDLTVKAFGPCDLFDMLTPIGPWLSTQQEIARPDDLELTTRVNGKIHSAGRISDTNWSVSRLVSFASQATLEPGDVIAIGFRSRADTPLCILSVGDVMECEVASVGKFQSPIVRESGAKPSH